MDDKTKKPLVRELLILLVCGFIGLVALPLAISSVFVAQGNSLGVIHEMQGFYAILFSGGGLMAFLVALFPYAATQFVRSLIWVVRTLMK